MRTVDLVAIPAMEQNKLEVMLGWAGSNQAVWLHIEGTKTCSFKESKEREETSKTRVVTESQLFGKSTKQTVTKIKENFYDVTFTYELTARCEGKEPLIINSTQTTSEVKTATEKAPMESKSEFIQVETLTKLFFDNFFDQNLSIR